MQNSKNKKRSLKKDKKLIKLINNSDSEDDSEHELSYYMNDRVKLMKQVLKIIKPNKIKSMAPDCLQRHDNEEINSMLLEELLGISNKRLKYIFSGQNLDEDSSSTDPEEEKQPIDIISLDDISDDDFVIDVDSGNTVPKKDSKRPKKKIKKEKNGETDPAAVKEKPKTDEQSLMSVLELLELQARARAIRSQLALENSKKEQVVKAEDDLKGELEHDDGDDVIIEIPKPDEIVISSESDGEGEKIDETSSKEKNESSDVPKSSEIIQSIMDVENTVNIQDENVTKEAEQPVPLVENEEKSLEVEKVEEKSSEDVIEIKDNENVQNPEDGIVINVDQSEIDCIISD